MKTRIFLLIALLMLTMNSLMSQQPAGSLSGGNATDLNVVASPDFYTMASLWAAEFNRQCPGVTIRVEKASSAAMKDFVRSGSGIALVSGDPDAGMASGSAWHAVVGRDVIIPVMNSTNRLAGEIRAKGISPEAFSKLLTGSENPDWGQALGLDRHIPMNIYMVNDSSVLVSVSNFIRTSGKFSNVRLVAGAQDMLDAIRKDTDALGFCRMTSLVDPDRQSFSDQFSLVPVDKNGNGRIDFMEDIYSDLSSFTRGVWIGKYPKALSSRIYAVAGSQPSPGAGTAFLTWVLTDGQRYLSQAGFSDLVSDERQSQLALLDARSEPVTPITKNQNALLTLIILLVVVAGGTLFFMGYRARRRNRIVSAGVPTASGFRESFTEQSLKTPKGLWFDRTHTWVFMEKNGLVRIGVDEFMQHVTGNLTRIDLKKPGENVRKGEVLCTLVRDGKQIHLYAPVSGRIMLNNAVLESDASALSQSPYDAGWLYLVEPANWQRESQFLKMAEKYTQWLTEEFVRLKDFFARALQTNTPEYSPVILQDGGALPDQVLATLDPRVWEDFQSRFIDVSR